MRRLTKHYNKKLTAEEAEQICRITIAFNMIAFAFLGLFAFVSFKAGNLNHGLILLGVIGFTLANILIFVITGRMPLFILITCFSYLAFCVYLQISGGQSNTGVLWHYVFPIMVYYTAGIYMGSICAGSLIFIEILLMVFDNIFPFQTQYSLAFKLRFLSTMIIMSIFGAMLEHSRWSAQSKLRTIARKFHLASQTDELTGLANRRALKEKIEDEITRSERTQRNFVIIICDIDFFKKINDQHGHTVGDNVLKHLADNFNRLLRKYDMAARWGGEEFLFLLPDTDPEEGQSVAERIRVEVEKTPFQTDTGEEIYLTISCGGSNWKEHPNMDDLIRKADDRLYKAKETGRNRVIF